MGFGWSIGKTPTGQSSEIIADSEEELSIGGAFGPHYPTSLVLPGNHGVLRWNPWALLTSGKVQVLLTVMHMPWIKL